MHYGKFNERQRINIIMALFDTRVFGSCVPSMGT